jgi:hypothetical protein
MLHVSSPDVGDKVRVDLMPIEDELTVHVSVSAPTAGPRGTARRTNGYCSLSPLG